MTTPESPMHLTICWLYPTAMNIYGDRGNVLVLEQRARWRGIEVTTIGSGIGDPLPEACDLFFIGGGQDGEQVAVAHDLQGAKAEAIRSAVEDGAALLAICGGYQLLGHEYRPHDAAPIPGIGLVDLVTVAGPERFIGNVVVESEFGTLVGFETHSGLTTIGPGVEPLGRVKIGHGNNGRDGLEGVRYRNAIGCYLHGSLLPKNPVLADWLITKALERRYGSVVLAPLDDALEQSAHAAATARAIETR
ncbi:MAG: type 1 glutamine amidotransferase [Chloroflexota bacterium]